MKQFVWCCVSGGIFYWWEATHPMPFVNGLIAGMPHAMVCMILGYAIVSLPEYLKLVFVKSRTR